jgi:2,3-diketo-5-methylthio-1-phosphopentane phosphatase
VAIYSSGSELAQRRLFASTPYGDLSPCISYYFDTAVGAKHDVESYVRIARALDRHPRSMLFVSDAQPELSAASDAGYQVLLSLRPGNPAQTAVSAYERIHSFDEVG